MSVLGTDQAFSCRLLLQTYEHFIKLCNCFSCESILPKGASILGKNIGIGQNQQDIWNYTASLGFQWFLSFKCLLDDLTTVLGLSTDSPTTITHHWQAYMCIYEERDTERDIYVYIYICMYIYIASNSNELGTQYNWPPTTDRVY